MFYACCDFSWNDVPPSADAMKFNGPAPEIINGRLAMLGIIAAAVNEANYSETVVQQLPHVQFRLILMTLLVSYSSLIPILKGAKSEAFGEAPVPCYQVNIRGCPEAQLYLQHQASCYLLFAACRNLHPTG